jgi:enamine deaminase RidA (YjgF/YER057c/UK114 family)
VGIFIGYSRAVRLGPQIFVSGTTATDKTTGAIVGQNDAYTPQTIPLASIFETLWLSSKNVPTAG